MDSIVQTIILGLTFGLVSNLHCIGMCGPIAMALPLQRDSKWKSALGISTYTLGRSAGYATLGVIAGFIGLSAQTLGVLQWLSIISGLVIIIFAWGGYLNHVKGSQFIQRTLIRGMGRLMQSRGRKTQVGKLLAIGLINAFLPCGMVYVALVSAINTGSISGSVAHMISFGVGTLPGFLFLGVLKNYFQRFQLFNRKIVLASLITVVGSAMVLRGLNLGIPYLSPKVEMMLTADNKDQDSNTKPVSAKMECCSTSNKCSDR